MSGLERGQKATGPERGRPGRSRPLESHVPGEEGGHVYYGRRGIEMQQEQEQEGEEEGNPPLTAFCLTPGAFCSG